MDGKKIIFSDNPAIEYMGRIDFSNPKEPQFTYAGCMAKAKFTGTEIGVIIKPEMIYNKSWIGAIVDGIHYKFEINKNDIESNNEIYIPIVTNLSEGEHTLILLKRSAGSHYFRLCGLVVSDKADVMPMSSEYDMKIEVYGDSVSAGEVVEAIHYTEHTDPENHEGIYDNSWFSYSLSLARKLNAEIHCNSQGGIALFDGTGYFNSPNLCGLESTYDKMAYVPGFNISQWDFSRFIPDLIVFAIGQNDAAPDPDAIRNPEYRKKWLDKYTWIIRDLQNKYNYNPKILLITTILMHDKIWDEVLDEACDILGDKNVRRYRFRRNGAATPGHPRMTEQEEMAGELYNFILQWN